MKYSKEELTIIKRCEKELSEAECKEVKEINIDDKEAIKILKEFAKIEELPQTEFSIEEIFK